MNIKILSLFSFLVGLGTYQHPCMIQKLKYEGLNGQNVKKEPFFRLSNSGLQFFSSCHAQMHLRILGSGWNLNPYHHCRVKMTFHSQNQT
jgi:hypothetical protein